MIYPLVARVPRWRKARWSILGWPVVGGRRNVSVALSDQVADRQRRQAVSAGMATVDVHHTGERVVDDVRQARWWSGEDAMEREAIMRKRGIGQKQATGSVGLRTPTRRSTPSAWRRTTTV